MTLNRPAVPASYGARQAMPAESFETALDRFDFDQMLRAMSGRLEGPDQDAFVEMAAADRAQVAALAARFWDDPDYAPLREWLLDMTLRRPISIWGLGEARTEYADRRSGANSVVWLLLQAVAEGRQELPPTTEGTDP